MHQRNKILSVILALFFVSLIGCTLKTVTKNTKLIYMYKVYNAQYQDYLSMTANPNTTEEQKIILRKKKPILDTLGTLIPLYDRDVQTGIATADQEQKIYDLLNSLN
jgi:hypothetical protein